jgi:outer membrane protein
MKNLLLILSLTCSLALSAQSAQKVGCIDSKYIFSKIPDYAAAETKLKQMAADWQKEIDAKKNSIDQLYKNFEADKILLSAEMKVKREQDIAKAEQELKDMQNQYFGAEGELFKQREKLVKPIQDKVYKAIKDFAETKGYAVIIDKAGDVSVLYVNAKNEISGDILKQLGYSN